MNNSVNENYWNELLGAEQSPQKLKNKNPIENSKKIKNYPKNSPISPPTQKQPTQRRPAPTIVNPSFESHNQNQISKKKFTKISPNKNFENSSIKESSYNYNKDFESKGSAFKYSLNTNWVNFRPNPKNWETAQRRALPESSRKEGRTPSIMKIAIEAEASPITIKPDETSNSTENVTFESVPINWSLGDKQSLENSSRDTDYLLQRDSFDRREELKEDSFKKSDFYSSKDRKDSFKEEIKPKKILNDFEIVATPRARVEQPRRNYPDSSLKINYSKAESPKVKGSYPRRRRTYTTNDDYNFVYISPHKPSDKKIDKRG